MVQFKNPTTEGPNISPRNELTDFTKDVSDKEINNFELSKDTKSSVTIPVRIIYLLINILFIDSCLLEKSYFGPSKKYKFAYLFIFFLERKFGRKRIAEP